MALTEKEKQLLKNVLAKYPQPETFDINEVKNPVRAREIWSDLERRGYAKISDHAICGFERVRGEFVSITEAGVEAVKEVMPSAA